MHYRIMLRGCIKGAASAIYSILYAARAEYGIYCPREQYGICCPGADILPGGKILTNIAGHT